MQERSKMHVCRPVSPKTSGFNCRFNIHMFTPTFAPFSLFFFSWAHVSLHVSYAGHSAGPMLHSTLLWMNQGTGTPVAESDWICSIGPGWIVEPMHACDYACNYACDTAYTTALTTAYYSAYYTDTYTDYTLDYTTDYTTDYYSDYYTDYYTACDLLFDGTRLHMRGFEVNAKKPRRQTSRKVVHRAWRTVATTVAVCHSSLGKPQMKVRGVVLGVVWSMWCKQIQESLLLSLLYFVLMSNALVWPGHTLPTTLPRCHTRCHCHCHCHTRCHWYIYIYIYWHIFIIDTVIYLSYYLSYYLSLILSSILSLIYQERTQER